MFAQVMCRQFPRARFCPYTILVALADDYEHCGCPSCYTTVLISSYGLDVTLPSYRDLNRVPAVN